MGRSKAFPCGEGLLLLGEGEQMFVLDSRAAAIWRASEAGYSLDDMATTLAGPEGDNLALIRTDVAALVSRWHGEEADSPAPAAVGLASQIAPAWAATWRCRIREATIDVAVEPPQHAEIFARWLAHLPSAQHAATARIEVRDLGGGEMLTLVDEQERSRGPGLRQAKSALVHLTWPEVPLCAMAHAGAVAGVDGAVCFAGVSGSGKSTLIAKLASQGYTYLADDLLPIALDGRLVPWPMPVSIKAGSWPVLETAHPSLAFAPSFAAKDTIARLLPLGMTAWDMGPQEARALVFPTYRPGETPPPERIEPLGALQALIVAGLRIETPVTDARIEALVAWLEKTPAYRLPFGDLDIAAAHVRDLLAV